MQANLKGNVAIISGALGDIGRAIAIELAARGADIALGDIHAPDKADRVLHSLREAGAQARYDCVDVADAKAVKIWVDEVTRVLSAPTLIIPNAAIVTTKTLREISAGEWSREIAINLNGAFHLAQIAGLELLKREKSGRIVFIGSWAAERPHPHIPAYSAAKAGLRMLMQCMALEFAPDILVNEIAPGYVDAGLSGRMFDEQPGRREDAKRRVPVQRLIEPHEVAAQVAHLCDPNNCHMTGSTITMDGGLSLQGNLTR